MLLSLCFTSIPTEGVSLPSLLGFLSDMCVVAIPIQDHQGNEIPQHYWPFLLLVAAAVLSTKSKQDIHRSPSHLRHCLAPLPACQATPTPPPVQVPKCRVHHPNPICVIAFNIPVGLWMGLYLHCLCRDAVLLLYFFCHLPRCCHLTQALFHVANTVKRPLLRQYG